MAEKKAQDQAAEPQTAAEAKEAELEQSQARNPIDLGTDLDKLPAVPGAGQFMSSDEATEETSPATTSDPSSKKG